jgi:hypothetical protein
MCEPVRFFDMLQVLYFRADHVCERLVRSRNMRGYLNLYQKSVFQNIQTGSSKKKETQRAT